VGDVAELPEAEREKPEEIGFYISMGQ
jgi:hypothetical protein